MSQPVLGALAGKKTRTHDDFVRLSLETMTDGERIAFAQMPPCRDDNQFIAAVTAVRAMPTPELPPGHPLGAAS